MEAEDSTSSSLYPVPTREALRQRRQLLQQQRRSSFWQASWRVMVTVGLLSGLAVLIRHPYWQLLEPDQIIVTGNQWLSDEQVRQQLELSFPIQLWHVQPQFLEDSLVAETALTSEAGETVVGQSPVRSALIRRQLLPAGLRVHVEERIPVARSTVYGIPGVVDQEGAWLSLQQFPASEAQPLDSTELPSLTVIGWEHHAPQEWATLLRGLSISTVEIRQVEWPAGEALRLETELGSVVLGSLGESLGEQLYVLGQMQDLEQYCNCGTEEIEFIDLTSAKSPSIQFFEAAAESRFGEESN